MNTHRTIEVCPYKGDVRLKELGALLMTRCREAERCPSKGDVRLWEVFYVLIFLQWKKLLIDLIRL